MEGDPEDGTRLADALSRTKPLSDFLEVPGELAVLRSAACAVVLGTEPRPSRVFGLEWYGKSFFLKVASDLRPERDRLTWLRGRAPVPVVHGFVAGEPDFLLLSRVAGRPAHEMVADWAPSRLIEVLARAMHTLHALATRDCPFDASPHALLGAAERRVRAGTLHPSDFTGDFQSSRPEALLAEARDLVEETDDHVITHGDFCLPNILLSRAKVGFVDVGLAGVGDRHRDLSLVDRSIAKNLGRRWRGAVFAAYGTARDPQRERLYLILDQLLMARPPNRQDARHTRKPD